MKIACLQMRSGVDQVANTIIFEKMVREAAAHGALYVQSPEMTGLMQKNHEKLLLSIKTPADTPVLQRAEALANELGIIVHVGSCAVLRQDGKIANRSFVFSSGALKPVSYDKIHMFDAQLSQSETWQESAIYEAGIKQQTFEIAQNFCFGLSICYDLRFPDLFRKYARAGCNCLTVPSAFTVPTGRAHWKTLIRARAIENGAYLICAAQGGTHQDGRTTYGHSMVVSPWGDVLELDHDEPDILYADLDIAEINRARTAIPVLKNERIIEAATIDKEIL